MQCEGKEPAMNVEQEKKSMVSKETTQTHLFTREPLSVLGKIAFWAFLVEGIGSLGGAIALTLGNGSPSRDIVITTVCTLAGAVILATRFRWAPLVSTILGGITSTWSLQSPMSLKAWPIQRVQTEDLLTL